MLDTIGGISATVHQVALIGAWTGLSAGAIAGCAALAWLVPAARPIAIAGAIAVGSLYVGELHGNAAGRAAVLSEWDAAKAQAADERKARDSAIAAEIEAKYAPAIAAQAKADSAGGKVGKDEREIIAAMAASGSCKLGPDALRLRAPKRK